jgi:hypothetical protein
MSIHYEESGRVKRTALFLTAAFLIIYCPLQLGDRELYWREGEYAAIALEMTPESVPLAAAHGEVIPETFPMFPWLAGMAVRLTGLKPELILRLISVLSLAGLCLAVMEAAREARDFDAGAAACAFMMSSNIIIEKAMDGYPTMPGLFFLFSAWMMWFSLGAGKGHWNKAWIYSLVLCGMAFYTVGWPAPILFFFPFVFMRRPLSVWARLSKPGFYIGTGFLLLFILLWGIPYWMSGGADTVFQTPSMRADVFSEYFSHLLFFPFDAVLRFMPWSLLAWAPFCVAFYPLDQAPIFSRYLRTVVISVFCLLWFSPFTSARDMIVLAPPLAALTGVNYWLLARRHGGVFARFLRWLSWVPLALGIATFAVYLTPWDKIWTLGPVFEYQNNRVSFILGMIEGSANVALGIYLVWLSRGRERIWSGVLLMVISFMLFFWAVIHPHKSLEDSKRSFARLLGETAAQHKVPHGAVIYKDKNISGLFGEACYLPYKLRKISSLSQLPADEPDVYLLSTDVPTAPGRNWVNLLRENERYQDKRICLWKGVKGAAPPEKK